jgi:predicted dehydrogenase
MSKMQSLNRRKFLARSAAAAGAIAFPHYVPRRAFGANERLVTGHIGVGGQGMGNLGKFLNNAAAVCDVDQKRLAAAVKRVEQAGGKCEGFGDYRRLLDRKDIDAVVISTPDHWHALPTIHACQAGKDVYCEKPLTLTIVEGRKMVQAARDNKRIVQTGSQQRSADNFRFACELVRSGKIGKVQRVLVGISDVNFKGPPVADSDPPPELDYEMWLGPAPFRSYNEMRVHYNFRFYWDYSGGQMTNWGAHHIDIAHWGLGMDGSGPVEIEGQARFDERGWVEVPMGCRLTYRYANGVEMIVGQGQKDIPGGTTFIGSEGTIFVNRGKLTSTPEELVKDTKQDLAVKLYRSENHHRNFEECVKSRELPICDVEIGHRTATACHLGNIALRLGRKIRWDPAKEEIVGDEQAAGMVSRPYRAPWVLAS